jgi:hypothetical protein
MEDTNIMKLLLNDKEIAHFLSSLINFNRFIDEDPFERNEANRVYKRESKNKNLSNIETRSKSQLKIKKAINSDARTYISILQQKIDEKRNNSFKNIHRNIQFFIKRLGKENILKLYKRSKIDNFIKTTGLQINPDAGLVLRKDFKNISEDCLIRHTVGQEKILLQKIDNQYPFWFIDAGYTNFLESKKTFHRLVRNHLHHDSMLDVPVDRMGMFKSFPMPWRENGEKILIIEPGPFAASIFHVDLRTWKYKVARELRKYTDKRIVFRKKIDKKIRTNLYDKLRNEDYYCVININSNAATEAIWAGIPVITLDKHITNPVTRQHLSDINNLYRPNLAQWLSSVSYSQFTYEELIDGTAVEIMRKYHVKN